MRKIAFIFVEIGNRKRWSVLHSFGVNLSLISIGIFRKIQIDKTRIDRIPIQLECQIEFSRE